MDSYSISIILLGLVPVVGIVRKLLINAELCSFCGALGSLASFYYLFAISGLVAVQIFFWFVRKSNIYLRFKHYLLFLLIIIANILLVNINKANYPNYLYSQFGIIPEHLIAISYFLVVMLTFDILITIYSKQSARKLNYLDIVRILGIIILFCYSVIGIKNFNNIKEWALSSYENKLGKQYNYYEYLIKYTPESSTIVHPTQSDVWATIGNQPINRYFLFPRKLISGYYFNNSEFAHTVGEIYLVTISDEHGNKWPLFKEGTISLNGTNFIIYKNLERLFSEGVIQVIKVNFK